MRRPPAALLALAVPAVLLAGLAVGAVPLAPAAIGRALVDGDAPAAAIVRGVRLPRVLLAFAVGGALGTCGAAMQAIVRNPLAEPYLLGLAGGAGLGAVLAHALGAASAWGVTPAAFAGALAAVLAVVRLATVGGRRLDPLVLLLAGVVIGAFCAAVTSGLLTVADATTLRGAQFWLLGSFAPASWPLLAAFAGYAVLPLALLQRDARALDLLALGDEPARHLGADVDAVRRRVVLAAALLTAAAVAVAGVIGFVGLVVPHATRLLWGPLHRALLPLAFLTGGCFLVLADLAARTVARPIELPLGAVTAVVGVPVFALLLRRVLR
ncbi:MAG: iron ABC transporter permease [Gemmatimonadales bacterium]|nr:iron ABC transporter permease [Gemmatimonadales bacterium]